MTLTASPAPTRPVHDWLRHIHLAYVPGPVTPLLQETAARLQAELARQGHHVLAQPAEPLDVLLTTAAYGEPLGWREALLFTGRRRFGLDHTPTVYTLIGVTPAQLRIDLTYLEQALGRQPLNPADFQYPGLSQSAHRTLIEQGRRGGPIMALVRRLQAQSKSIRVILVVGEQQPVGAYYFDLVGAHPYLPLQDPAAFYTDMATRIVTSVSTTEITQHQVLDGLIPRAAWDVLDTPAAMRQAGRRLGERGFFTEMVRVTDLVNVPAIGEAVANQYSEGCFATWEPGLEALLATITGSARPVEKENITDDELAVIVGVRADGRGAQVRHVEAKRNDSPSSEAVEMLDMDFALPRITLGAEWGARAGRLVPVVRSKLHGHRGVAGYDPARVELLRLDEPYYHYPVSCSTEAQARAIKAAFSRAESLRSPDDPRQVAFTLLPGHGIVVTEKWVAGKEPFQVLWEHMDAGWLRVENRVPQGTLTYADDGQGQRVLRAD